MAPFSDRHFTDTDDSSEKIQSDSELEDFTPWISRFCSLEGHGYFCPVEEQFIEDRFNLHGLDAVVPSFKHCLDIILDLESSYDDNLTEGQNKRQNSYAEKLYGLIHARYIISTPGLAVMREKYKRKEFGLCPRVGCTNQAFLPVGESDIFGESNVKLFCPRCEDIYYPKFRPEGSVDGACFGTTFPHLFLMTYPDMKPEKCPQSYVPRVFGFKIRKNAQPGDTI